MNRQSKYHWSGRQGIRVLLAALTLSALSANAGVVITGAKLGTKASGGTVVSFPDVCKTPGPPGGPVPIPYPNSVSSRASAYKQGSKKTQSGESLVFKQSQKQVKGRKMSVVEVQVLGANNRPIPLRKSTLFRLQDGTYCAVCMQGRKITQVLKLYPLKAVKKPPAVRYEKLQRKQ